MTCQDENARTGNCAPARRRLPPYGAALRRVLASPASWAGRPGTSADGRHPTLWVLAGPDAWETAYQWTHPQMTGGLDPVPPPLFVLAPPAEAPGDFDWSLLRGHPPALVRPCGDLTHGATSQLVAALLRDGAGRVLVMEGAMRLYQAGEVRHG
jgi:hypothetical protein